MSAAERSNLFWRLCAAIGLARTVIAIMLIGLLALRATDPWPVEALRLKVFDFYQQVMPRQEAV